MVQWLRLCAPNAGSLGSSLVRELDPTRMPQVRVCMPQLRSPHAATKTRRNQVNKYFSKRKIIFPNLWVTGASRGQISRHWQVLLAPSSESIQNLPTSHPLLAPRGPAPTISHLDQYSPSTLVPPTLCSLHSRQRAPVST